MPRLSVAAVKCGPDTTTPAISIVPSSTPTKPAIARSNVVLPQPELPTTQPISPRSSDNEAPSMTGAELPG